MKYKLGKTKAFVFPSRIMKVEVFKCSAWQTDVIGLIWSIF